jgi:GrpB-like predicted nucleotidyltransferase (UPF0157 family)
MAVTPVEIVDYDPAWPRVFEELRWALEAPLGGIALAIEHVGSTSIPGLAAKPIIDLDIVVAPADVARAIEALASLGYVHEGDNGVPGREAFARESGEVPRTSPTRAWPVHHLYVCPSDSAELARHIAFREMLRNDVKLAQEYGALKRELAKRFRLDREGYMEGKTGFIEAALREQEEKISPQDTEIRNGKDERRRMKDEG